MLKTAMPAADRASKRVKIPLGGFDSRQLLTVEEGDREQPADLNAERALVRVGDGILRVAVGVTQFDRLGELRTPGTRVNPTRLS